MKIEYMKLDKIQPSQTYICQSKLDNVKEWIDVDIHNYDPIPVKNIGGKFVFTDGHTKALAILQKGKNEIKVCFDEENIDLELYEKCIELCVSNKILDISSLNDRIVDCEKYEELWYKKCADLHEEIQKARAL